MSTEPSPTKLSFLDLPPEVRNKIYESLLVYRPRLEPQTATQLRTHTLNVNPYGYGRLLPRPRPVHAAILSTNRQIRLEASSILFSQNWVVLTILQSNGVLKFMPGLHPVFGRFCERLHLTISCFVRLKTYKGDLERTRLGIENLVRTLQYNTIKGLVITVNFWFHEYGIEDYLGEATVQVLKPFEKLKGVTTVIIENQLDDYARELAEKMKIPRSEKEEAVRLKGWLAMGDWDIPPSADYKDDYILELASAENYEDVIVPELPLAES